MPTPENATDVDPGDASHRDTDIDVSFPTSSHGILHSQGLVVPPEFHRLQLGIDTSQKVIVCQGCQIGIHCQSLTNHIRKKHGGLGQLPPDYDKILDAFHIPDIIIPPLSKVAPLQSIPILHGFMCTFPGCGFAGIKKESISRNHLNSHQPFDSPHITPSAIQIVRPGPNGHQTWAVDENYSSFCAQDADFGDFFAQLAGREELRWVSNIIEPSTDPCHVNGFLEIFGWLKLTSGLHYRELHAITQTPSRDDPLNILSYRLGKYFDGIRPIVNSTSPLILKWVNSTTK